MVLYIQFASHCHDYDVVNTLQLPIISRSPYANDWWRHKHHTFWQTDTRLSDDEQHFIERLIPGAKDKKDKLLFTIT